MDTKWWSENSFEEVPEAGAGNHQHGDARERAGVRGRKEIMNWGELPSWVAGREDG
jgi:hypothetical protein